MRRYSVLLPLLFIALSAALFVAHYFCMHSQGFYEQGKEAAKWESEPPLVPYLLPAVSIAFIRGPAVILSTFDIDPERSLLLLPLGCLWWWWIGKELDQRGNPRKQSRIAASASLIVSILALGVAILIIPSVAHRYWSHMYFGLFIWRAAMWTADVLWLFVVAVVCARQSVVLYKGQRAVSVR